MSTAQLNWTAEPALFPVQRSAREVWLWYAIQTRLRFERKVFAQLESKGIETFLPLVRQTHRWSDRRQVVEVPLFPGYGFVHLHLDPRARLYIVQTAGLMGFVSFGGEPTQVPPKQIENIRQLLAQELPCAMYPFLKAGQRVRIRGGCLDGIEGILISHGSNRKLLISVEAIERTIAIQIEGYDIEPCIAGPLP
jgi:transcription antitermination factor NusG